MIFDTVKGAVIIGGKRLAADVSPKDVLSSGFFFEREIDMKTGWVFRNTSKDDLEGHAVMPALGFHADQLKRVSFTFLEDAPEPLSLAERHREFLLRELGVASRTSADKLIYDYQWGQISAEDDARNGTSYIIIIWT